MLNYNINNAGVFSGANGDRNWTDFVRSNIADDILNSKNYAQDSGLPVQDLMAKKRAYKEARQKYENQEPGNWRELMDYYAKQLNIDPVTGRELVSKPTITKPMLGV